MEVFRPCISLQASIATAHFKAAFDLEEALNALSGLAELGELKLSRRLGILKSYGVMGIMLFEDGSVTVKPADDKEEVYKLLKKMSVLLVKAQKCPLINGGAVAGCDRSPCPNGCEKMEAGRVPLVDEPGS